MIESNFKEYCANCPEIQPVCKSIPYKTLEDEFTKYVHQITCRHQAKCAAIYESLKNKAWNDPEEPPETDMYILLSFSNLDTPLRGRFIKKENGDGAYCIGDTASTALSHELFVNGWMPLPAPKEDI